MTDEFPTSDEVAERIADAIIGPLREVGTLLAREVDRLNVELERVDEQLAELGTRVERLAELAGEDGREHSVRVPSVREASEALVTRLGERMPRDAEVRPPGSPRLYRVTLGRDSDGEVRLYDVEADSSEEARRSAARAGWSVLAVSSVIDNPHTPRPAGGDNA